MATNRRYRQVPVAQLAPHVVRGSHAAIPVVLFFDFVAAYLGTYSILAPAFFAFVFLYVGVSFLFSRVNPLSTSYYLPRKPSWAAIGLVFLSATVLFAVVYAYYRAHIGTFLP